MLVRKLLTCVGGTGSAMRHSINTNQSMAVCTARQGMEDDKGKLKKLLAEQMLDNAMLRDINSKNSDARWEAESGGAFDGGPSGKPATGV